MTSKKKDEMTAAPAAEAKRPEGEKKYIRLPDKVAAGLPAAALLLLPWLKLCQEPALHRGLEI